MSLPRLFPLPNTIFPPHLAPTLVPALSLDLLPAPTALTMADNLATLCNADTFSSLSLPGATVLSIVATLVTGFNADSPAIARFSQPAVSLTDATFCNITVTYTHPGKEDQIFVETWLPISSSSSPPPLSNTSTPDRGSSAASTDTNGQWNGRLQAVGGGGWVAGRSLMSYMGMYGALADGYATTTTDAGLPHGTAEGESWALLSPGHVDMNKLQNLASVSLDDEVGPLSLPCSCLQSPGARRIWYAVFLR